MSNIRPLHDRIVVKRESEEKSAGGIIFPDTSNEKPLIAVVMAVGPGKTLENGAFQEITVKKGDRVLIGKYAGTEIEMAGEKLVVVREDDIMGVIEK